MLRLLVESICSLERVLQKNETLRLDDLIRIDLEKL